MKILNGLMWFMFAASSAISVMTMIVTFGMVDYSPTVRLFANMLPLEISLSVTLFLWAINSLYKSSKGKRKVKRTFFCYLAMGFLMLVFVYYRIY